MHLDSRHFDFYNYFSDAVEFKLDFKSLHLALYCLERQIGNDLLTNQRFTRSTNDIIHLEFFDLISIDIECNVQNHHGAFFSISHIWRWTEKVAKISLYIYLTLYLCKRIPGYNYLILQLRVTYSGQLRKGLKKLKLTSQT